MSCGIHDVDDYDVIIMDQGGADFQDTEQQRPDPSGLQQTSKYLSGTQKRTVRDVKFVKEWLQSKGYPNNIEEMSDHELNFHLERFYREVRTKDNIPFSRKTLTCIRSSVYRHLMSHNPSLRNVSILKNPAFTSSNNVLGKLLEDERSREKTTKKNPLSKADLRKIFSSDVLSVNTPRGLQWKVWVDIVLHFGVRGNSAVKQLSKSSFTHQVDEKGREYFKLNYETEKDTIERLSEMKDWYWESRMYKDEGNPDCAYRSLCFYLSKLDSMCDSFFQKPIDFIKTPPISVLCWYYGAMGGRSISRMMAEISQEADLSRPYTNICLRATQEDLLAEHDLDVALQYRNRPRQSSTPPITSDELLHFSKSIHRSFYSHKFQNV